MSVSEVSHKVQPVTAGLSYFWIMATNTSAITSDAREGSPLSPPCTQCAGSETEPIVTMQRHTVDADPWYQCEECGHIFAAPREHD